MSVRSSVLPSICSPLSATSCEKSPSPKLHQKQLLLEIESKAVDVIVAFVDGLGFTARVGIAQHTPTPLASEYDGPTEASHAARLWVGRRYLDGRRLL